MTGMRIWARGQRKVARAQAQVLREQARTLRRENDEREMDDMPWWRQRTLGNAIASLITRYGP